MKSLPRAGRGVEGKKMSDSSTIGLVGTMPVMFEIGGAATAQCFQCQQVFEIPTVTAHRAFQLHVSTCRQPVIQPAEGS